MKNYYSILSGICLTLALVSCQMEIEPIGEENQITVKGMSVTASMGSETKTILHENGYSTYWTSGDKISVFDSKQGDNNRLFNIEGDEFPVQTATFTCEEEFTMPQNNQPDPLVVALYPYQKGAYCDFFFSDRNYITGISIPAVQTAVAGGFDHTATLALATAKQSTRHNLQFNNLYSLFKLTFKESGVKKVTVTAGEGEFIAGAAKVQLNLIVEGPEFNGGTLSAIAEGGSQSASLVCEDGFDVSKTYYLAVAPGTYSSLSIMLDDVIIKTIDTKKTLEPNKIYGLKNLDNPATAVVTDESELKAAFESGGKVILGNDIVLTSTIVNNANVILDLNGNVLSYTTTANKADELIDNKGNLTILDSKGEGRISYKYEGQPDAPDYTYANATIQNGGSLTIESGTIENTTDKMSHALYVIDESWSGQDKNLIINGGNIISAGRSIRMVNWGDKKTNNITINRGHIEGSMALQVFLPEGSTSVNAPVMNLNINGGELISTDVIDNGVALYVYGCGQSGENVTVNISNGTIGNNFFVYNAACSVNISGGIFDGYYGIYDYGWADDSLQKGTYNITGGQFTMEYGYYYVSTYNSATGVEYDDSNGTHVIVKKTE